jgi:hypothetical protein
MKKIPAYLIILLVFLSSTSFSQNKPQFRKGFVIDLNGDTLKGKLLVLPSDLSCEKVTIQLNEKEEKTFKPQKAIAYLSGLEYYKSLNSGKHVFFARRLAGGEVSLYQYVHETSIPLEKIEITEENSKLYLERGAVLTLVNKSNFKKSMAAYFSTYPELAAKISKGTYKFEDIKNIVFEFNLWHPAKTN